jgi:actin-related protein 3
MTEVEEDVVVPLVTKGTPLVIDVGTGYTKVGYACNAQPTFILPTVLGPRATVANVAKAAPKPSVDELDFLIGEECLSNNKQYPPERFVRHGLVTNWDLMEKFYEQIFFRYLRANPEDQPILIVCSL